MQVERDRRIVRGEGDLARVRDVGMILEITPHIVVAVADPPDLDAVGVQEDAGILQAAHRHDEGAARHPEPAAGERGDARRLDARGAPVRFELDEIGIEEDADVARAHDTLAISRAEPQRVDPEEVARLDPRRREFERIVRFRLAPGEDRLDAEDVRGAAVIGFELAQSERPAALGNVVARLEIDAVEGAARAGPMVGGPAEEAQTVDGQVRCLRIDDLAFVQALRIRIEVEAAALQKQDAQIAAGELQRERQPGGARPGDAQVRIQRRAMIDLVGGQQHRSPPVFGVRRRKGARSCAVCPLRMRLGRYLIEVGRRARFRCPGLGHAPMRRRWRAGAV